MWRNIGFTFLFVVLVALCHCSAFQPSSVNPSKTLVEASAKGIRNDDENNRRKFFAQVASATLAIGSASLGQVNPAQASGGATAGGAYLLSAKQRYNDRVIKGIKGFLALESSLKAGSVDEAKAYFAGNEEGQFGDISTAGYLLANAFRTNSNKAPDSLPSVKVSFQMRMSPM